VRAFLFWFITDWRDADIVYAKEQYSCLQVRLMPDPARPLRCSRCSAHAPAVHETERRNQLRCFRAAPALGLPSQGGYSYGWLRRFQQIRYRELRLTKRRSAY